jgi:hypothetical protein
MQDASASVLLNHWLPVHSRVVQWSVKLASAAAVLDRATCPRRSVLACQHVKATTAKLCLHAAAQPSFSEMLCVNETLVCIILAVLLHVLRCLAAISYT